MINRYREREEFTQKLQRRNINSCFEHFNSYPLAHSSEFAVLELVTGGFLKTKHEKTEIGEMKMEYQRDPVGKFEKIQNGKKANRKIEYENRRNENGISERPGWKIRENTKWKKMKSENFLPISSPFLRKNQLKWREL